MPIISVQVLDHLKTVEVLRTQYHIRSNTLQKFQFGLNHLFRRTNSSRSLLKTIKSLQPREVALCDLIPSVRYLQLSTCFYYLPSADPSLHSFPST